MDQVRNVSDECNNIFTVYDNLDTVIIHVMINYKDDLIIYIWVHVTVIIYYLL